MFFLRQFQEWSNMFAIDHPSANVKIGEAEQYEWKRVGEWVYESE